MKAIVVAAAAVSLFGAARATASDSRTATVVAEGPDADSLETRVAARLRDSYAVRDAREFRMALGGGQPIVAGLKSRRAGADLVARARAAAVDAHVDVAVLVSVRKSHRATVVHVWVVATPSGTGAAVDKEITLGAGASPGDEAEATWGAIKDALPAESPPPPAPSASPAPTVPESSPPPSTLAAPRATEGGDAPGQEADALPQPETSDRGRSLLRMGVAIEAGSRHFAYVDRLTATLRPYDLFAAPLASLRVELLPFVRSASALLEGLGLEGEYSRAFAISSADAAGTSVSTTWQNFHADVRELVAIGPVVLAGAHAGFGSIDFSFDEPLGSGAELPSVGYRFVRAGLDGRVTLRDFSIYAGASYLAVLSTGAIGSLFPHGSTGGLDATAGLLWPVARHLELSFELAYTRFFYSLHPVPGDANVAGGALDEMASASLGLAYRL